MFDKKIPLQFDCFSGILVRMQGTIVVDSDFKNKLDRAKLTCFECQIQSDMHDGLFVTSLQQ